MDQVNKQVLTVIAIAFPSICALAMLGNLFEHKTETKRKQENEQKARAIYVENDKTKKYLEIFLDTNHHPQTTEASVKVLYGEDFPAESIQQVISNNQERTVWEWKRWGIYSKLDGLQK